MVRDKLEVHLTIGDTMSLMRIVNEGWEPKRQPSSPIGEPFNCRPCGHLWSEHDDDGCLWLTCLCWLPGERK